MNSQERKAYGKAYYEAHKKEVKAYAKEYYEAHKEQRIASAKAWQAENREHYRDYQRDYMKAYSKSDVNSLGQTKGSIRKKSQRYLKKYGTKIPGYQIHHCCTYDDPYKFIYCSKEMHRTIHSYLKAHGIDADSDHYEYIKHILDESVVKYNID